MKIEHIFRCILLSLIMLAASKNLYATDFTGKVFLRDSTILAGDYAMIYCPDCHTGVPADSQGWYRLTLKDAPDSISLEFSRVGYETKIIRVANKGGEINVPDVILEPQILMLTAAYITPKNMDPAQYILSRVWKQSKENRRKQMNYRADIEYEMATHELPVIAQAAPKGMLGYAKFAVAMYGYGPLARYCLENDDFRVKVSLSRTVKGGRSKDYDQKLLRCDQKLPKKVEQNVLTLAEIIDLFDIVYGDMTDWAQDFSKKNAFKLQGTYDYNGKYVDVIEWHRTNPNMTALLHIVEEDWGILKMQMLTSEGEVLRCEARDAGNGVYMPISFLMKPAVTMIRAEKNEKLMNMIKENKSLSNKTKQKALKILEEHKGEDFNPYFSLNVNVKYYYD